MTATVVLCVGNPFRRDDGVASAVAGLLRSALPEGVPVVELDGEKLPVDDQDRMKEYRLTRVSIIPQYAMSALMPIRRVGQIIADLLHSRGLGQVLLQTGEEGGVALLLRHPEPQTARDRVAQMGAG